MLRPPRHPLFWLGCFVLWFAVLWLLSSGRPSLPGSLTIPHLDKIAHFGYFFGGGGILTAYLFCRKPSAPSWRGLIALAVIALALIGGLDEYHQTFTPGRLWRGAATASRSEGCCTP